MKVDTANEHSQINEYRKLTFKEKVSYGLADTPMNISNGLVFSALTFFYTNYVGVPAATVGLVMLLSRFFDGISDLLMSFIVNKTSSKHGSARPWILWVSVPYGLSMILLMTVPKGSEQLQFWYILITYNLLTTIFYTALSVPYGTLATLMTRSSKERNLLSVFRMGLAPLGRILTVSATVPLVNLFGNDQKAWVIAVAIWAVVAVVLLLITFRNCEEWMELLPPSQTESSMSVAENLKLLFKNKYFWIIMLLWAIQSSYSAVFGTVAPYYSQYILGNTTWVYSTLYLVETLILVMGIFASTFFLQFTGKRNLALIGSIIVITAQLLIQLNPQSIAWIFFTTILRALGTVPLNAFVFGMLGDVVEFGEWRTGIRQASLIVGASTMGVKLGNGLSSGAIGWLLDLSGYQSSSISALTQPNSALHMIQNLFIWGPIVLWLIALVLLLMYQLDKIYPQIIRDLNKRES